MHSNYGGGVSEMQQFMMDGCPPSLFSISTSPPPPPPPQNSNSGASEVQKFHPLQHHLQQPPPMPQHFAHFGQPIPITQQLFQQSHHHHAHHHHQLQLFQQHQQQHMGLDQESGPENSNSPARMMGGGGGPSFLAAMNFKLGVNESSGGGGGGGGSRDGINEDDQGILQGDDDGSESGLRHHHHHHHHQHRQPWHREEESAANIKEPFWRPLDIDFINPNNKRPAKDKQPAAATTAEISSSSSIKHFKKSNDVGASAAATDSNYKLFSELEAIYKPGGGGGGGGVGGGGGETNNNQTGSGSALTGDDNPLVPVTAPGPTAEHGQTDNISDTSNADDAPQKKAQRDDSNSGDAARRKRSRKRRQQKQLSSVATFLESLVKRLMDHQESLHRKFLDVMEKKDQERSAREEACRKQEAAKANREAAARAQERALAATREAAIISFLEKISGESLNLPAKAQFHSQFTEESHQLKDSSAAEDTAVEIYNADSAANNNSSGGGLMQFSSSRWPKAEVQALIRVRSGFEAKFQEPGLKGPLWEEVSLAMAAMGYQRSAKRCKEKWENINKYFRKTKDSGKKRPQHSKTCPYFHLLDQLYSKTPSPSTNAGHGRREKNSELLDAIVVPNEAKGNEEGNEEEGQGESQDQEGNADGDGDGDRSPARTERNQEHNSGDRRLLNRLNS